MTGTTLLILGAITHHTVSAAHGGGADIMTVGTGASHTAITVGTTHSATTDGITVLHGITHGITTVGILHGSTEAGTAHGIMTVYGIIHGTMTAGIMEDGTTLTIMDGTWVGTHTGTSTAQPSLHTVRDIWASRIKIIITHLVIILKSRLRIHL